MRFKNIKWNIVFGYVFESSVILIFPMLKFLTCFNIQLCSFVVFYKVDAKSSLVLLEMIFLSIVC